MRDIGSWADPDEIEWQLGTQDPWVVRTRPGHEPGGSR